MADKTLKINIVADAGGFVSLTKGFETVAKTTEEVGRAASSLAGQFDLAKSKVAEFTSLKSQEYADLTLKLLHYNDLVDKGIRSEVIARGNAQASITKYNTELAKTTAEYERLALAMRIASNLGTGAITKDNRGYTANTGEASRKQKEADDYALVASKLANTRELENRQLSRHIAYENTLKQQQIANISSSVAQQAEIRSREENTRKKELADLRKYIEDKYSLGSSTSKTNIPSSTQAITSNTQALKANGAALQETERHTRNLFIRVGEAIGSYRIWNALLNTVFHGPTTITQVGIELEATQSILQSTMGSAAGAAGAMRFLDQEAARTGITISTLRTSWRDFSASTTLAGMSLQSSANMFSNLNTVITALHLTSDRAQGVFNAMAQIFNKSKVQSEELVKQLGNLLPGAFAMFAASVHETNGKVGISTQELAVRMKKGMVFAKDTMEDFAKAFSDKFAASFGLASQGMNSSIGRMQTSFTHLGEAIYGLSSGPIVAIVKGITNITDALTKAVNASGNYSDTLTKIKSVFEGIFVVGIGIALANIAKLDVALKLLSFSNVFTASVATLAASIAYIYNKIQGPLDRLKEAQERIKAIASSKIVEDKSVAIEIRVENARDIVNAKNDLDTLRKALEEYRVQNKELAKEFSGKKQFFAHTPTTGQKEEYAKYLATEKAFNDAITESDKALNDSRIAEQIKIEAFDKEQSDRVKALQTSTIGANATSLKGMLKDDKILIREKLDILTSASKAAQNITEEEIAKIEALHTQGKSSEYEYQDAIAKATAAGLIKQQEISNTKLEVLRNEKAALDALTRGKSTVGSDGVGIPDTETYNDAVIILEKYNKALEDQTIKLTDNRVAFKSSADAKINDMDFATKEIEILKTQVAAYEANVVSVDKLSDAQVRAKAVAEQIRTVEEEIAARKTEMNNANIISAVELSNLKKEEVTALKNEQIQYLELTSQVYKAIEAKRELALTTIEKSGVPQPIKDQQVANVEIQFKQENIDAAKAYQDQLDAINDSTKEIGLTSTEAFDIVNKGFGGVAQTFKDFTKGLEKTAKALRDNAKEEREMWKNNKIDIKDKERLSVAFAKKNRELELDQFETAIGNTRQIASATAKMFDEKSAAAQGFNDLASALAVVEMAMEARKVALYVAGIIPKLAAGAATMFAQSGWGGFAGVAAMAAVMVGLGVNYATSGGNQTPPEVSGDTGTVLGDKAAKSESLTNVANLLEEIHAKEYRELRGINNGIISMNKGVTDTITRMFQAGGLPQIQLPASRTTGLNSLITLGSGIGRFDPISNAINNFLFGGKQTKSVVGQGIATGPSSVGSMLKGDIFYASYFADIMTKTKGGIFSKDKTSYERIYQQMDGATTDALTKVFRTMGVTMFGLAEQLGVGLGERVKNYVIPALFIDLQGLNGEDAAKKVNGVISTMLDSMSTTVFGDIVGRYQKLGEGMLETAVRIIAEVAVVKDALGISGIELTGNAIAISDALIQAAGSIKIFQDQFENYYNSFYSNAEKQTRLYGKLSETFTDVGSIVPQTRKAYRDMLEALDLNNEADRIRYSLLLQLTEAADSYYSTLEANKDTFRQAFHTEAENQARAYGQLSKQLATVTLQLPTTRDGFRQLVEGLDLTNTADRERYYLLLELSGAADSYYQSLEAVAEAQREAARAAEEALRAARAQARQDIEAAQQLKLSNKVAKTDAAFAAYEKQLKSALDATLKSIEAQKKVAQDIVSKWSALLSQLKSAKESTVVDTLETSRLKRLVAESVIASAANQARTGAKVNTDGLETALTEISKPSENFYGSFADYAIAQARTGNDIEDLTKHATKRMTAAEKNLAQLEASAKAAQEYYNTSIATAREQIDAIRNVSRNILTLADAIAKEGAYRDKISKGPNQNLAILNAYEDETGLTISGSRMAHFQEVAKRRGLTQAELEEKIANSRDAQIADLFLKETGKEINANRMRRYLAILKEGGTMADVKEAIKLTEAYKNTHFNGLASVPYDGYQATLHKNEAVIDAQSVGAIQRYFKVTPASGNNNAISEELLAELKLLRKTVEEQGKKLESIDKSSKSSADTLDKSSAGGPLLVQVV